MPKRNVKVKRRATWRTLHGRRRRCEIVTFDDEITDEKYDEFLDLRTDEYGTLRSGDKMPVIDLNNHLRYSSYVRLTDTEEEYIDA